MHSELELSKTHGPLYDRLAYIAPLWDSSTEVLINLEAFNGYTTVEITIPMRHIRAYREATKRNLFEISIETGKGSSLDVFEFCTTPASEFSRTNVGILITYDASKKTNARELSIKFRTLSLQRPLPERVPFNRVRIEMTVKWPEDFPLRSKWKLLRPLDVSACWTKGNYDLAFPSRNSREGRLTTILFPQHQEARLNAGFQNDIRRAVSDVLGLLLVILITHISIIFMLYYRRQKADADLIGGLIPLILLGLTLYSGMNAYLHTARHSYYSGKRPFQYLFLSFALPYLVAINGMTLYGILSTPPPAARLRVFNIELSVLALNWVGLAATAAVFLVVFLLYRVGYYGFFVCDQEGCANLITRRFAAVTCPTTGRVMCAQHQADRCSVCVGNPENNRYALSDLPGSGRTPLRCQSD